MRGSFIHPIGRQWLTVLAVVSAIAINGLSNFFPPAGKNIGELSNTTLGGVLITPAGYAFAIWGVIYVGLIAFSLYQVQPAQRYSRAIAQAAWAIIAACSLQMLWVYVFLISQFWGSVLLIGGILAVLAYGYLRSRSVYPTRKTRWLVRVPMSLYFAWITVATVVNVASAGFASLPPSATALSSATLAATVVMMGVSAALAAIVAIRYADIVFPAVVIWALCAIAVRQANIPPLAFTGVALSVGLCIAILYILSGSHRPPISDPQISSEPQAISESPEAEVPSPASSL